MIGRKLIDLKLFVKARSKKIESTSVIDPNHGHQNRPFGAAAARKIASSAGSSLVIEDFEQSLESLRPSTRRVYVRAPRHPSEPLALEPWQSPSTDELLALIRESPTEKRISPFLAFLGDGEPKNSSSDEDISGLQNWVIQTLSRVQIRGVKQPSLTSRRDLALIAAMCAAPARVTPLNRLKVRENQLLLWDAPLQEPALAHALRFWHAWRERLARPDQRRLYRKSLSWSQSGLVFPGSHGASLGRAALHNGLRPLSAQQCSIIVSRQKRSEPLS
jgi:hypothetical protein